jgi:hypothetical protein
MSAAVHINDAEIVWPEEPESPTAPAEEPWVEPTNEYFRKKLRNIIKSPGAMAAVAELRSATHPRLQHPFFITAYNHDGAKSRDIPVDPAAYASALLHVAKKPTGQEGMILDGGMFGYEPGD